MKESTLRVLFTFATGTAVVASMQSVALADDNNTSTNSMSNISGVVTADVLNIRANPNTSSTIIGSYTQNTKVTILGINNGWYKVSYNNKTGWIYGEYVTLTQGSQEVTGTTKGIVRADVLNVRSGEGTNYSIIGTITENSKVDILSTGNGWCKIKYNNSYGFVSKDYITIVEDSNNSGNSGNNNSSNPGNDTSSKGLIGTVTADALNVRSGAGTNYSVISSVSYGTKIDILSNENGWYKIKLNNGFGYVSGTYVQVTENSGSVDIPNQDNTTSGPSHTVQGKIAIVTADALNIRSGPGTSNSIVGVAHYGSKYAIVSCVNGWYQIESGNVKGYVSGDYITIANEGDSFSPLVRETALIETSYTGEQIVEKAKEYIGVPYLWGGFTPMGFDCSGLVQYVYKQFGINLERTTYYQVHQGKIVGRNELRAGDLIFFTTNDEDPNDISHVGLYVGNDLFIQAPKPGDTVRISNLNSAYYSNRYYVAKRIIK